MHFQKQPWAPFAYGGTTYVLSHLDEFEIDALDAGKTMRRIAVTCTDHCFTRKPEPGDDPALVFPGSSRRPPGHFCVERYEQSLRLKEHLEYAAKGKIWHAVGGNFVAVPVVDVSGKKRFYAVHFALRRTTGLAVDCRMIVNSGYLCDENTLTTLGKVKFATVLSHCIEGKKSLPITDRGRARPKLS